MVMGERFRLPGSVISSIKISVSSSCTILPVSHATVQYVHAVLEHLRYSTVQFVYAVLAQLRYSTVQYTVRHADLAQLQ